MSLYRLFSSAFSKPYLPDPFNEETKKKEDKVTKANTKVIEAIESQDRRKRPRDTYTYFSPELHAKIGKFAAKSGNKVDVENYSREVGKPLSKSTVRGF